MPGDDAYDAMIDDAYSAPYDLADIRARKARGDLEMYAADMAREFLRAFVAGGRRHLSDIFTGRLFSIPGEPPSGDRNMQEAEEALAKWFVALLAPAPSKADGLAALKTVTTEVRLPDPSLYDDARELSETAKLGIKRARRAS